MAVDADALTAEQLREQTLEWLRENLPAGWMEAVDAHDEERLATLRRSLDYDEWCVRFGEAGYATPTWPAEYGAGLSLTPGRAKHVNDVLNHYRVPRPFNIIGIGMGGPTVLAWGSEDVKQRLVKRIATNQDIWCQLFSEPGAGSDVAGLSTRAVRDGDEWVVNGQKVWTTLAHEAKWCMLVARSDPDVPKHKGLTYFLMDMEQDEVDVRPLRQITGEAEFNELFIENAYVPDENVVGGEGNGWMVAITTLMNERAGLGASAALGLANSLDELIELAKERDLADDPLVRDKVARLKIAIEGLRLGAMRALTATMKIGTPGPEGSIAKLQWSSTNQALTELALAVGGIEALSKDDLWSYRFLRSRANSIEGGTSDVLKNIVAERVLGLPKLR